MRLLVCTTFLVMYFVAALEPNQRCAAQVGFAGGVSNSCRFIDPPRSLSQRLREAEEAIANEQYSEAIVILGDLLEQDAVEEGETGVNGQDFFLEIQEAEQQRLVKSFLRHCRDIVGNLPNKAIETYELRYGALARQMLESASASRDWRSLREVRRKYFHTTSGYQASALLAQREIYLGHPLAASFLLDDLVANPRAVRELGQGIIVMHAVACRLGGRKVTTDPDAIKPPVEFDGKTIDEKIDSWRVWIDDHYAAEKSDWISRSMDYELLGGNPGRNETVQGQLPLSTPRWMVETTATPREEKLLGRKGDELSASGQLVPPSWLPLKVEGQVLMRTTERLMGVDHRTGKRVWQYPWFQTSDSGPPEQPFTIGRQEQTDPEDLLGRRVWNDVPYGQLSSDGERVFLLDDLAELAQNVQFSPLVGIRGAQRTDASRNTLVALELETEGKMLWRLGQNPTVQSELNDAFFLGVPLPIDGSLYAMVELAGDVVLVCLDPATGKLRWKQQLVAVEGFGIQHDSLRRVSGATPSYHQGVLICPTGAGATVAVDLGDRTLRWGNSYPRRAWANPISSFRRPQQPTEELQQRWHHPAAIASGNSVVVSSPVTDLFYCFDLADGKKRFMKPRQAAFYVAGLRGDSIYVVSAQKMAAYDLTTGRLSWESEDDAIAPGSQIVGRGVFDEEGYLLPTSNNELVLLSLKDGSVLQRRTTRYPLGNLVAIDGEILTQGTTHLAIALGETTLGPRVERMLKENPDDLDALIQKALLLTEQGERNEALKVLERARGIDPDSDDVTMLSINAMLGVLRESEEMPEGMLEELDWLIDTTSQRLEFLALKIENALKSKSVQQAAEGMFEFSTELAEATLLGNEDEAILRDPGRSCSLNSWVASKAAELGKLADELGQEEELRSQLEEFLQRKRLGSTRMLTALVKHYEPLGIDDLVVRLSERLLDEEKQVVAERLLLGAVDPSRLLNQGENPYSERRMALLAEVYAEGRMAADAGALLQTLKTSEKAGEENNDAEDDEIQAVQRAVKSRPLFSSIQLDVDAPVTLDWDSPGGGAMLNRSINATRISKPDFGGGNSFRGWALSNTTSVASLQDPLGNDLRLPLESIVSTRRPDRHASISGGIMLAEEPGQISALDLFSIRANRMPDAKLWTRSFGVGSTSRITRRPQRTDFGDSIYSYPARTSTVQITRELRIGPVLGDRVVVLQAGDLMSIALSDGETMWRNSQAPGTGMMVVDDDRLAVVSYRPTVQKLVTEFDLLDGKKLDERPWEHGTVWAARGKHVLAYQVDERGASATVRLINPFTDETILETEAPVSQPKTPAAPRGFGRILQKRYMVLFDSQGRLTIWDLLNGIELCQQELAPMPELEAMFAIWMDEQILILPANRITLSNQKMLLTRHGETHRSLHKIIAVSTGTGGVNWEREFEQPWGCTVNQPQGSPVLVLARSWPNHTSRAAKPEMDVQLLRLQDGATLYEELKKQVPPGSTGLSTAVKVQPSQQTVFVRIEGESLRFTFGAEKPAVVQPE